ncbi:MAG: YjbH domain-containing protein [bacterium]
MKSLAIIGCLSCIGLPAFGAVPGENRLADSLKSQLIQKGFENVAVIWADKNVTVTYENRIYRHEVRGIQEVLWLALPLAKEATAITLIPQNRKIPLGAITVPVKGRQTLSNGHSSNEDFAAAMHVTLDVDSIWGKIKAIPQANSSSGKFEIVIHPQFIAQFGNYDDPVKSQINLVPEINAFLWKGMSLSAQLIIPLQNELEEEGNDWRPGLLTLSQTFRLPRNYFLAATMGYFTRQRYGFDLEIKKYLIDGKASLGANVGYTGHASYLKGAWYYSTIDILTALVDAEYRVSPFDLIMRATYGKFLYQDRGGRLDVLRQFGELDIGFFVSKTQIGTNGGFNFAIPLFPPKYLPTGSLRIRPASYFPWEYRYWGIWESGASGYRYKTGNRLNDFMQRINPDYVKNQFLR